MKLTDFFDEMGLFVNDYLFCFLFNYKHFGI